MTNSSTKIQEIQRRYKQLSDQKVRLQTQRESALAQLAELEAQAQEQFGTSDEAVLQTQLEQIERDNEAELLSYQSGLEKIESQLKQNETHQGL